MRTTGLDRLPVLLLDCQATGPAPDRDHLMEIGWAKFQASETNPLSVSSFLVKPPPDTELPRRVQRVTGMDLKSWQAGLDTEAVWTALTEAMGDVVQSGEGAPCPLVIHFSRFELPFLEWLGRRHGSIVAGPMQVLCTHEISKRLLPDLPRRGLRAVAGYLGHSAPETRRSAHHVEATAAIWRGLVERLRAEGIESLDELVSWLAETPASTRCGRGYPMGRRLRLALPAAPGVYRIRRVNGDILYVGKANCLKRRVNSHFQKRSPGSERALEMLAQARDLDVTVTASALEAALLESDEIKRLSPPYNVLLRAQNRELIFCDPQFQRFSPRPAADFPMGPFIDSTALETFGALVAWLAGAGVVVPPEKWRAFAQRAESPSEECLVLGLEQFAKTGGLRPGAALARRLLGLGDRLWLRRVLDRSVEESDESVEAVEEDLDPARSWTPERVVSILESATLAAARAVRRARWFCWLMESTIVWPESSGTLRMLAISEGEIVQRGSLPMQRQPPAPREAGRDLASRRLVLDLEIFDRLSVLTAELRRLASAGRTPQIRLGRRTLDGSALGAVLRWV